MSLRNRRITELLFWTVLCLTVWTMASFAHTSSERNPRVCFPAEKWQPSPVPRSDRPCVHIRLYEDGSFDHKVREADGDRWVPR